MLVGIPSPVSNVKSTQSIDPSTQMVGYLVDVAQTRSKASFAKVFNYFAPRLRSYALKQMGSDAQAMELVQDTMSNVWQKAHLFNADKGSASTWIFTIARNIRFDMLRKQKNRKEDICADDLWPVLCEQTAAPNEISLEHQMMLDQIEVMFERLPDKQRVVIQSIYIDGKSQQEVADELGIPLGTVKSRTRLALERLRELIKSHD
ncbi:sigma-70 family RNA polymerase sigma factor [Alteromonadaceae bacterium M269]|nr:sigma-70 family RNA polymerase sigma factor [Alteromonadaceae bacterium M269]